MKILGALLLSVSLTAPQAQVISQGRPAHRVVALTFDAGADRGYAARILATLERNHIHATFGMTGRWAQQNPDLVRRMARDHDRFINHTYDHRSFTGYSTRSRPLSTAQRVWEIRSADSIVRRLTGHSMKPYFRPPYGDYDNGTLTLIRHLGYRYMIMWTIDSGGWEGFSVSTILQRCLENVQPGAIIAMHVGAQSQDAFALQPLITALKRRGYRFVTIPQLLGH
ncbi:MAG TPA: polysaccharide deacetylase family protein [Chloroflexota bacterium]|nr:polysaccharide deacetylase family protein [Chloroflexota bacterium]